MQFLRPLVYMRSMTPFLSPHASIANDYDPPWLQFEPFKLLNFPDPAFHSNVDPDPTSQHNMNPEWKGCFWWEDDFSFVMFSEPFLFTARIFSDDNDFLVLKKKFDFLFSSIKFVFRFGTGTGPVEMTSWGRSGSYNLNLICVLINVGKDLIKRLFLPSLKLLLFKWTV